MLCHHYEFCSLCTSTVDSTLLLTRHILTPSTISTIPIAVPDNQMNSNASICDHQTTFVVPCQDDSRVVCRLSSPNIQLVIAVKTNVIDVTTGMATDSSRNGTRDAIVMMSGHSAPPPPGPRA